MSRLATSGLDVYAHNVETVKRLQRYVRDKRAGYEQSLTVLQHAKAANPSVYTKTSLMLGLGETDEEVLEVSESSRRAEWDRTGRFAFYVCGRAFLRLGWAGLRFVDGCPERK